MYPINNSFLLCPPKKNYKLDIYGILFIFNNTTSLINLLRHQIINQNAGGDSDIEGFGLP